MDGEHGDDSAGIRATLQPVLRIGIAALLLGPGVSTFLAYGRSVRSFETLGLPASAVLVPVVGTAELGIAVLPFLDRAPRAAAETVVPVTVVTAVMAGPTWRNPGVLVAAVVLIGTDTTPDSVSETEPTA